MRYSDDKIQEVRDATSIEEIISQHVTLKKRGRGFIGLCPFHQEKTPSFHVDPERQFFHCFGCNEGGNVFTFLMKIEGISFPEAVRTLAEKANIPLPQDTSGPDHEKETEVLYHANQLAADFYKQCLYETNAGKKALTYLTERNFSEETIRQFDLGYAPNLWDGLIQKARREKVPLQNLLKAGLIQERQSKTGYYDRFRGRLMFPIKSSSGRVIGFGGRILIHDKNVPKYLNSPETAVYHKSRILYGIYESRDQIRKAEKLLLVEGYTDVMRLFQVGFDFCAASSGTALTPGQANLIRRYAQEVILIYDGDSAGLSAALRGVDILLNASLSVKVIALPKGEDPDSFAQKNNFKQIRKLLESAHHFMDFQLNAIKKSRDLSASTGKTKAVYQLMETVGHVKDPVQRSLLVREVSEKMNIDESILIKQFKKQDDAPSDLSPIAETVSMIQKAEQGILSVLIEQGEKTGAILFDFLEENDFIHPREKEVFLYLKENYSSTKSFAIAKIHDHFLRDPGFSQLFTELEVNRIDDENEQLRSGKDCLMKVKTYNVQQEIKKVQDAIKSNPNSEKMAMLQQKFIKLKEKSFHLHQSIEDEWQKTVEF